MVKKLNVHRYNDAQIIEALTHPINRYAVMKHYSVDEWWLHDHPDIVMEWWINHGGAVEFAKQREKYMEEQDELEKQKKTLPLGGGEDYTSADKSSP